MSEDEKACAECGEVHKEDPLFTEEVRNLFQAVLKAQTPEEREAVVLDLGRAFMDNVEPSDDGVQDEVHDLIQEATEAHLRYQAAVLRVGRMVVRHLKLVEAGRQTLEHLRHAFKDTVGARVGEKKGSIN